MIKTRPGAESARAPDRLRAMVSSDRNHVRAAKRTVALVRTATVEAQRSKLPQMAAALAFRTIFSLIPVMVVGLVALRLFYDDKDITGALNQAMQYSGISQIAVDQAEMGPFPPWDPRSGGAPPASVAPPAIQGPTPGDPPVVGAISGGPTTGSDRLDQWISDLVTRVSDVNLKAISAIGIIFVVYAAIGMLVEIERAFNQIYRVPVGRSWVRRIMQYWTLLTLGAAGLFATFYVGQKFMGWLTTSARLTGPDGEETLAVAALGYFSTVAISTLLLLLTYLVVPNTKVRLWPALAGAFMAALLWEAGKWGFTQYLHYSAFYARLYGSIALIPLFLLWVYVTWVIVLVGLQVSYYLQHGRHHTVAQPSEVLEPAIVDPSASLMLIGAMARSFEAGKPASSRELAHGVGVQEGVIRQLLSSFAEAGLVLRISEEGGPDRYSLARPIDKINAEEVLRIGETLANPSGKALDPIAERMRQARIELVRGRTVAGVLDARPRAAGEPELVVTEAAPPAPPAPAPPGGPAEPPSPARVHPV